MKRSRTLYCLAPAALIALSGASLGQTGYDRQQQPDQRQQQQQRDQQLRQQQQMGQRQGMGSEIARADVILGAEVRNQQDERIGRVNDLIIDPRSGEIEFAALSHGGFLGIGRSLVLVPWQMARWNGEEREIVVNITRQQLESAPAFEPARWPDLDDRQWYSRAASHFGVQMDGHDGRDQMTSGDAMRHFDAKNVQTVRGAIRRTSTSQEGQTVTVRADNGREYTVVLAPAAHLQRQNIELTEGEQVVINGFASRTNPEMIYARDMEIRSQNVRLRDQQGSPLWQQDGQNQQRPGMTPQQQRDEDPTGRSPQNRQERQPSTTPGQPQSTPQGAVMSDQQQQPAQQREQELRDQQQREQQMRKQQQQRDTMTRDAGDGYNGYVRLSELQGATIVGQRQEEIGDVRDVAVRDGQIPFAVISIGGFLGVGETLVAIPWSMLTVVDEDTLAARTLTRETLENAPRITARDWSELEDPTFTQRVHQHFGATEPQRRNRDPRQGMGQQRQQDAWNDEKSRQFSSGRSVTLDGTVSRIHQPDSREQGEDGVQLLVRSPQGERVVYLAPAWFLSMQDLDIRENEQISLRGKELTMQGRPVVMVTELMKDGAIIRLRQADGAPLWIVGSDAVTGVGEDDGFEPRQQKQQQQPNRDR